MGFVRVLVSGMCVVGLAAGAGLMARGLGAAEPTHSSDVAAAAGTEAQKPVVAASAVSMDQAVKMAEQHFKARVVRAAPEHDGERVVYVLKLLNEAGQVWTVRVDAANGAIL